MTNKNGQEKTQNHRDLEDNVLDHELDAALAKFVIVEPRAGLEERIVANLWTDQKRASIPAWWSWPAVCGTIAALILGAVFLAWKTGKLTPDMAALPAPKTLQGGRQTRTPVTTNDRDDAARPSQPATMKNAARQSVRHLRAGFATGRRLNHFPSPRPLSEEEKLLVRYVRDFPREAVEIANEQSEFEKEMENLGGDQSSGRNSNQQER